jgi:hypothetical protein
MPGVTIYRNREPRTGGELVLYSSSSTKANKRLVFVNGICNTPPDHQAACKNLCRLTGCEVLGVYNQTGMHARVSQNSLFDKVTDGLFDVEQAAADWIGVGLRTNIVPILNRPHLANGCASSLFSLLLEEGSRWPTRPLCIVAHSQGNLIASNALAVYSQMVTKHRRLHPKIQVFAIASPAPSWPTNAFISVNNYWHKHDPVTAVSMWRNLRGSKQGHGAMTKDSWQHPLNSYLADQKVVEDICAQVGSKSPF